MLNVIGLGYIGLPTAIMFAANGIKVVGTDINPHLIDQLNKNTINRNEDDLDAYMELAEPNIQFSTNCVKTDKYLLAMPTPYLSETKKVDLSYLLNAMEQVLNVCEKGSILIIESTIAPGTIEKQLTPFLLEHGFVEGKDIHLVHAPERIIPGKIIHELIHIPRIIGANKPEIAEEIKRLYQVFCKGEITTTSIKYAELSKVIENTFRDVNIAFANEIAKICHIEGLDPYILIELANKHPRVKILRPGPGVGGHCLAVDPWFLVGEYGDEAKLIRQAREINTNMPEFVLKRLEEIMHKENIISFSEVGLYGLTYKEDIDDIRESPTLQFIELLHEKGINDYKVFDPYVEKVVPQQVHDFKDFLKDIQLVVVFVAHQTLLEENLVGKIIFDTKGILKNATYHL